MVFFDCRGMIYQRICPLHQRINGEYYTTILKQLLVHILRKHLELVNDWILHQHNALPHKACCITEFLEEHNIKVMKPPPPYIPDLTSCDFYLFPALKNALRGWQFYSDGEFLTTTQTFFNHLPKSQFRKTFVDK